VSDGGPTKIGPNPLVAEQARLARFFQTINKHRKALDLAIEDNDSTRTWLRHHGIELK
jgi:hypothetical protein